MHCVGPAANYFAQTQTCAPVRRRRSSPHSVWRSASAKRRQSQQFMPAHLPTPAGPFSSLQPHSEDASATSAVSTAPKPDAVARSGGRSSIQRAALQEVAVPSLKEQEQARRWRDRLAFVDSWLDRCPEVTFSEVGAPPTPPPLCPPDDSSSVVELGTNEYEASDLASAHRAVRRQSTLAPRAKMAGKSVTPVSHLNEKQRRRACMSIRGTIARSGPQQTGKARRCSPQQPTLPRRTFFD
jgi:hypothetical protein